MVRLFLTLVLVVLPPFVTNHLILQSSTAFLGSTKEVFGRRMSVWLFDILQEVWRTRRVSVKWNRSVLVLIHKKNNRKVCNNYRGIALLSIPGKDLSLILLERLQTIIDPQLLDTQCGLRKGWETIDQIWVTQQLVEQVNDTRLIYS